MSWNKRFILCMPFFLLYCGIDEVIYLEPVENSNYNGVISGNVRLPNNDSNTYFRNYEIYYRIYTSNISPGNINPNNSQELININPSLNSDYNYLNNYITNENSITSGMDTIFENRRYYQLYVSINNTDEIKMDNLLSKPCDGLLIYFDFTDTSSAPFMSIGGVYDPNDPSSIKYNLFRASKKFTIFPPDRLLYLSDELINNVDNNDKNLDVKLFSDSASDSLYAYISIYIIAKGTDNTFSQVFSRPRHIGIFRLP